MKLRTFSSIGGLRLIGSTLPSGVGKNREPAKDILDLHVRPEDLVGLAAGILPECYAHLKPGDHLVELCSQLVTVMDEQAKLLEETEGD